MSQLLTVQNLTIGFRNKVQITTVVEGVSFSLARKKCLAIVGESGSGKSLSSLALMGLLPGGAVIEKGSAVFHSDGGEVDLLQLDESRHRKLRGSQLAMIFQEPMTALNPTMRCGKQVAEMILTHENIRESEANKRVLKLFTQVNLPHPAEAAKKYPHQLSGGQRQRVMIAMAIACKPKLLIADEPTTALDVTVQAEILQLLKNLQESHNMAMIFITHDLGVVRQVADDVLVMYRGKMEETGPVAEVLQNPQSAYTKGLLACRPPLDGKPYRLPTVAQVMNGEEPPKAPFQQKLVSDKLLLEVKNIDKWFDGPVKGWFGKPDKFHALQSVSLGIKEGQTVGLVGESGCGKSTLGRCIVRLLQPEAGQIFYEGKDITHLKGEALRKLRREIQIIFQDPFSSLNPRMTVGQTLVEPMAVHGIKSNSAERRALAISLLQKTGLSEEAFHKYPHEFSGGQRQRIGIARALTLQPRLIVCDESVSALDVSVQAQVLNLLNDLKEEFGFSYLFISHDLSVVKYMSDQLLVMQKGQIVESGDSEEIYHTPKSDYTKKLLNAIPQ